MKAKRIISCLLTSAMAAGTWVIPVSAADAPYKTRYEGETWVCEAYPEGGENAAQVHTPGTESYKNALSGNSDGGWVSKYDNTPETVELSFEINAYDYYKISGVTTNARDEQGYSAYEIYIDNKKIECDFAGFIGPFDSVKSQNSVLLTAGSHTIKFELKPVKDQDQEYRRFGIDYIDFSLASAYEGEEWVCAQYPKDSEHAAQFHTPGTESIKEALSGGSDGGWITSYENTPEAVELSFDVYAHAYYKVSGVTTSPREGLGYSNYTMYIDEQKVEYTADGLSGVFDTIKANEIVLLDKGNHTIKFELEPLEDQTHRRFGIDYFRFDYIAEWDPSSTTPPTLPPEATATPEVTTPPETSENPEVTTSPKATATPVPTPVATLEPGVIKIEGENMPGVKVFDSFKSASGGLVGGFGVDYVQDENTKSPITISFDFEAPRACDYSFEFVTSHANNSNFATSPYEVYVNGTKCDYDMPEAGNVAMSTQTVIVPLNAGKNTVRFETTDKATFGKEQEEEQYYRFFIDYVKFTPTESATVRQEGEDIPGVESKGNYTSASGGHTGGFGADYQQNEHTAKPFTITMTYNAPAAGYYRLDMRVGHANNPTVSPYDIFINGKKIDYAKPAADGMALCTLVVTEKLNKGENTIAFTTTGMATVNDEHYYRFFIDYIDFTRSAPERSIVIEAENPDSATYTSGDDVQPIESPDELVTEFNTNTSSMLSDTQDNRDKYGADARFDPASGGKYLRVQAADGALPVLVNYKFNVDIAGEYEIFVTKGDDDNVNLTQGEILVGGEQLQVNTDNASSVEQVGYLGDGIKLPVKKFRMNKPVHLEAGENTLTMIVDAIAEGRTANTLMYTLDRIDIVKKIDAQNITMYTENHAVKKGEDVQLLFKDGLGMPFTSENVGSVTYEVSNGNIAEVSEAGVVTGVNLGECDITAEINDNGQSYTATASIIVCDESGLVIDSAKKTDGGVEVVFAATERGARFDIIAAKSGKTGDVKNALADINIQGAETIGYIYQTAVIPISAAEGNEIYEVFVWDNEDDMNPLYNKITVK